MTLDEFEKLVDAYGADASRWPEQSCEAAQLFAESSSAARQLLLKARALDGLLDQAPVAQVSSALAESILASAPRPQASGFTPASSVGWIARAEDLIKLLWPQTGWFRPVGLLTATLAFGFYLGFAGGGEFNPTYSDELNYAASIFDLPEASDWDTGDWQ